MRILFVILAILLIVPGWSGEEPIRRLDPDLRITATRVQLDPRDARRTRVGDLRFLGGVAIAGSTRDFGGFSALAIRDDRFTLLADGGRVLRFRLGQDWIPRAVEWFALPGGPETGWEKRQRDSESLVVDDAANRAWIGFENANAIWRYAADLRRVSGSTRPVAMQRWRNNGGAEAMARLPDGRFVVFSETGRVPARYWRGSEASRQGTREMLIFARDPVGGGGVARAAYVPGAGFDVVDAVALEGGDLLVLERRFDLPYRFSNRVALVAAGDLAPNKVIRPRPIAALDRPLIHDNFEGIAIARDNDTTIVWLVSDDNQSLLQRTLLLKFALLPDRPAG